MPSHFNHVFRINIFFRKDKFGNVNGPDYKGNKFYFGETDRGQYNLQRSKAEAYLKKRLVTVWRGTYTRGDIYSGEDFVKLGSFDANGSITWQ
jgi:hypothetical protein